MTHQPIEMATDNDKPISPPSYRDGHGHGASENTEREAQGTAELDDLDEDIRREAYAIYLSRDGKSDDPVEDWLAAERAVRGRRASTTTS